MSEISCEDVLHELDHYLHGELEPDRAARLADHLAECGTCLDHADFRRRLREVVRTKCRSDTPVALVERVRLAIRMETGRGSA